MHPLTTTTQQHSDTQQENEFFANKIRQTYREDQEDKLRLVELLSNEFIRKRGSLI